MSLRFHGAMILAYVLAAITAAGVLPATVPQLGAGASLAGAAVALAVCIVAHALITTLRARSSMAREMRDLKKSHGDVMRELNYARAEVRGIHDALEGAEGGVIGGSGPSIREVKGEIDTLRREIARLHEDDAETRPGARPGSGMRAGKGDGAVLELDHEVRPALEDSVIIDIVREAIDADRVDLYLQPIVSLPQRKHRFYECFSRIRDEKDNIIVPEQYLAIAEREGLIAAIDNILLIRCIQLVRKVQKKKRNTGFFINISAHTMADVGFFREFVNFMEENASLSPYIIFEFTQDVVADMPEAAATQLMALGEMGFRFSLDRVKRLDINYAGLSRRYYRYLKIDCSTLISHLNQTAGDQNIVEFKTVLDRFGIDLIVERIEEEADLIELLDFGIDYGQGYLFGDIRPAR